MSAQKAKGTRFETAVRDYLREHGLPAYRPAQEGFRDVGDIHGVSPFVVQCKDWRDVTGALREGVTGAQVQAANAGEEFGVAVIKRARKPVGDAYVAMTLADFVRLWSHLAEEHELAETYRALR